MYDIYVSKRSDLLVVPKGTPLPHGIGGQWRKKYAKKSVSEEIKASIQALGFYQRRLATHRAKEITEKAASPQSVSASYQATSSNAA